MNEFMYDLGYALGKLISMLYPGGIALKVLMAVILIGFIVAVIMAKRRANNGKQQ